MINKAGLEIIKSFEGWSAHMYLDPIGIPTIGYGSTWDANGNRLTIKHPPISKEEGETMLRKEVRHVENAIKRLIKVPLTLNEFSALCSFTYNVGSGNLQSSTLRNLLNQNDYDAASNEFPKWRRAGGKILKGLVRRRIAERNLFEDA
jgi:lysozyme|tara:strand:- start:14 stop:457 length:444 start_codon:yes stop_codon:yes gene_type:complete